MHAVFDRISDRITHVMGSPWALFVALTVILVWLLTGPIFGFSDTWQLIINTGTTIVTFLMVFVIQSSQNRYAKAVHLKLDELIVSIRAADNAFMGAEMESEAEQDRQIAALRRIADLTDQRARDLEARRASSGRDDAGGGERPSAEGEASAEGKASADASA